ncbi:hypothetical protein ACFL3G_03520 [Planctomycetota bacterium]
MKSRTGFTKKDLIVFLICFCFVLLNLAAIGSSGREAAKKAICLANVRGTMLAVRSYCENNDDYLPIGRSGFVNVYMSLIDLPVLLTREGFDQRKLHCPGDIRKPGSVTAWMEIWYNNPDGFVADCWLNGVIPSWTTNRPDFSYIWPSKMFLEVDPYIRLPVWVYGVKSWKLEDVRHPSRLIAYSDFAYVGGASNPWPHSYKGEKGILGGFVDGHSAYYYTSELDIERQHEFTGYDITYEGSYGPDYYSTSYTIDGIKGYDVLE